MIPEISENEKYPEREWEIRIASWTDLIPHVIALEAELLLEVMKDVLDFPVNGARQGERRGDGISNVQRAPRRKNRREASKPPVRTHSLDMGTVRALAHAGKIS